MTKPATKDLIFVSIQLALFIAFLIPVSLFPFQINDVLKYTSLLLSSIGFVTIFVAFIQLEKNLTPFPTPKENGSLIQTGLYKFVRHPIYSGIILATIFFGLYQQSFWKISIGISLLKNAVRLEWLFEKATEMGIYRIAPLLCERTIHERFKTERMQHILQSAMIQSQQAWLPTLDAPISFNDFISKNTATQQLIAHCEPAEKTSIKAIQPSEDCILLIGPEGDFTIPEIKMATEHHYIPLHLGPTRLRTETAGIFALSVLKIF